MKVWAYVNVVGVDLNVVLFKTEKEANHACIRDLLEMAGLDPDAPEHAGEYDREPYKVYNDFGEDISVDHEGVAFDVIETEVPE